MRLTVKSGNVIVIQGELLQLLALLQAFYVGDVIVVEGGPLKVDQSLQIFQSREPSAVQVEGSNLSRKAYASVMCSFFPWTLSAAASTHPQGPELLQPSIEVPGCRVGLSQQLGRREKTEAAWPFCIGP